MTPIDVTYAPHLLRAATQIKVINIKREAKGFGWARFWAWLVCLVYKSTYDQCVLQFSNDFGYSYVLATSRRGAELYIADRYWGKEVREEAETVYEGRLQPEAVTAAVACSMIRYRWFGFETLAGYLRGQKHWGQSAAMGCWDIAAFIIGVMSSNTRRYGPRELEAAITKAPPAWAH